LNLGYSIGVVGLKDTSYNINKSIINSWDIDSHKLSIAEKNIGLLKKCKLYVGTDTGPSHLAAFLQKPMIIFTPQNHTGKIKEFKNTNLNFFRHLSKNAWKNPNLIIQMIKKYFEELSEGR
ncbi:MAG: glycosyltransferase family 9 protein, partial [Atribacterota bacterium]